MQWRGEKGGGGGLICAAMVQDSSALIMMLEGLESDMGKYMTTQLVQGCIT